MSKNIGNTMSKNLSGKYSATRATKGCEKLLDSTKKSGGNKVATCALKTASKRASPKIVEVTGNLIGINIADKIRKSAPSTPVQTKHTTKNSSEIPKEIYIPPEKRQIADELRLI